jgi:hypothetical protein
MKSIDSMKKLQRQVQLPRQVVSGPATWQGNLSKMKIRTGTSLSLLKML